MINKPVLLFGGKGGVGKTTCSAAVAAYLAGTETKTIVITSDMAPSLSDIFEIPIGTGSRRSTRLSSGSRSARTRSLPGGRNVSAATSTIFCPS